MISTLGPRARQVYTILRDSLLSGEFAPGAKLPSHPQFAAQFGVATLTVRHVLDHLEQEGLLSREHGRYAASGPAAPSGHSGSGGSTDRSCADAVMVTHKSRQEQNLVACYLSACWMLGGRR